MFWRWSQGSPAGGGVKTEILQGIWAKIGSQKASPRAPAQGEGVDKNTPNMYQIWAEIGVYKSTPQSIGAGREWGGPKLFQKCSRGGAQKGAKNAPEEAPKIFQNAPGGGGECAFFMHGCWGAGIYQSFGNQFKIKTRIILLVGLVATGPLLNPLNRRNSVFGAECVGSRLICGSVRRWWTIFEQSYFRDCKKMVNSGSTFDLLLIKWRTLVAIPMCVKRWALDVAKDTHTDQY